MNYPGGFGTLRAMAFVAILDIENVLEHDQNMDSDTREKLTGLLSYIKDAMSRADAIVEQEPPSGAPYYVSPDHGVLETKEQFDALMDDIDEDTSPCNYEKK